MNCWQLLGIEPDSDAKSIKLAYAKLLKSTRPDDDPEGFAALHYAYKTALSVAQPTNKRSLPRQPLSHTQKAKNQPVRTTQIVETPEDSGPSTEAFTTDDKTVIETLEPPAFDNDSEQPKSTPVIETLQKPAPDTTEEQPQDQTGDSDAFDNPAFYQQLQQDAELLRARVSALLESPEQANTVTEWQFIESLPSMVDLNFSAEASSIVFDAVSQANLQSLEQGDLHIQPPTLRYLNAFFQWESNWQRLDHEHGSDQTNAVLTHLTTKPASKQSQSLHYFSRILAFAIDMLIALACVYIAREQPGASFFNTIAIAYVGLVMPLMEASRWQATFGKRCFQLAVVRNNGLRLRWYHSFFRSYISYFCLAAFKITVWINIFISFRYNALLQDILSQSQVISRD